MNISIDDLVREDVFDCSVEREAIKNEIEQMKNVRAFSNKKFSNKILLKNRIAKPVIRMRRQQHK